MGRGSNKNKPTGLLHFALHLAFPPLVVLWPRPRKEKPPKTGKQSSAADSAEGKAWSRQISSSASSAHTDEAWSRQTSGVQPWSRKTSTAENFGRGCTPLTEDCMVSGPAIDHGAHQQALVKKKSSKKKDHGTHTPVPHDGKHGGSRSVSAIRPLLAVSLVLLGLFRFASEPTLGVRGTQDMVILTFQVPSGFGLCVALFWAIVLGALVAATFFSRRPGSPRKPIGEVIVPEIGALLLFFVADCILEVFTLMCDDTNSEGFWGSSGSIAAMLLRRWFIANFGLLVSITIVESLAPPRGSYQAIVFDAGWLLILAQAVTLFLHHSVCRQESLHLWGSTFAAALYGLSLYQFTHSVALVSAVVFRKHVGVHMPPNVFEVFKLLVQDDPLRNTLAIVGFVVALAATAVAPALLDWGRSHAVHESSYAIWLQAVSAGICSGPYTTAALTVVNVAALAAAVRCAVRCRGPHAAQHAHASWEAELTVATGCLASLCWWALLFPGHEQVVWWQSAGRALGALAHIVLAAFSADVFAARQEPVWYESLAVTFWAGFQVVQGLAMEHHACMCHGEEDHSLSVGALLEHGGEFGLCEFGLITTLGWVTYAAEHVEAYVQKRRKSGTDPELGKSAAGLEQAIQSGHYAALAPTVSPLLPSTAMGG